jgi:PIN domain nuclease of toxin-antitoxin system
MPDAVTDTHALIWYLQKNPRLSAAAAKVFDDCRVDGGRVRVPSISAVEIVNLAEKGRIDSGTMGQLLTELRAPDTVLQVVALTMDIVAELPNVPRAAVPDMPDRIIAATALWWRLPLISRDRQIVLSAVPTIW